MEPLELLVRFIAIAECDELERQQAFAALGQVQAELERLDAAREALRDPKSTPPKTQLRLVEVDRG